MTTQQHRPNQGEVVKTGAGSANHPGSPISQAPLGETKAPANGDEAPVMPLPQQPAAQTEAHVNTLPGNSVQA